MKQALFQTSLMGDLHALGSGLKAVVTYQVSQGIEQCRMSCGGNQSLQK